MSSELNDALRTVKYGSYRASVAERAKKAAASTFKAKSSTRSHEQIYEDFVNGFALEEAVLDILQDLGASTKAFSVRASGTYAYDIIVEPRDGTQILIDIKGLFGRSGGNWITMSKYEHTNAPANTLYVAFEDLNGLGAAEYIGWCKKSAMQKSKHNDGYYTGRASMSTAPFMDIESDE